MECLDECLLPRAPKWPPVLQIPVSKNQAVDDGLFLFTDLSDASCRGVGSCAATFLVTGSTQSFVGSVMDNMFPTHNTSVNLTADISALADFVLVAMKLRPEVSNAYFHLRSNGLKMSFDFVREMPRASRLIGLRSFGLNNYGVHEHANFICISYENVPR